MINRNNCYYREILDVLMSSKQSSDVLNFTRVYILTYSRTGELEEYKFCHKVYSPLFCFIWELSRDTYF